MRFPYFRISLYLLVFLFMNECRSVEPRSKLDEELKKADSTTLAKEVREHGNANRGAVVFYRPELACARCHTAGEEGARFGPDLALVGKDATDIYLIESILFPSKSIKKGFDTTVITLNNGKSIVGLLVHEQGDVIVVRDSAQDYQPITISKNDIDTRANTSTSLMPEGLTTALSNRQEFLDLCRFLMEIAEKGPSRARELRPASSLFALAPLPEYEKNLDHAGLLRSLNAKSLKRGEAIYLRVCANCHGTKDEPGSMPTSLRFAEGKFKNGAEPWRMYQTLTHGFGMMTPQTWMVPQQKYDVIHYLRETYLKLHNPSQYTKLDNTYLASLPKGNTQGPKPSNIEPWAIMNYGPSLMATLEVGEKGNFAYKGIAMRLDHGPGGVSRGRHWMLFDHDTMRVAAAWSGEGFIDWNGINFNGRHGIHPRLVGQVRFANPVGPGWANPETGKFNDPRLLGRDGKPYGPLPREWAQYRGLYHYGDQTILSYSVGQAKILESPALETAANGKVAYSRTLNVGISSHDLLMRVAPVGTAVALVGAGKLTEKEGYTVLSIPASTTPASLKILMSDDDPVALQTLAKSSVPAISLEPFTKGGPRRWPEVLKTQPKIGNDDQAFAIDVLTHPTSNPWNCEMRLSGFDFYADAHKAAVCTWDGDVWLVDGLDDLAKGLTWQRIASGMFQPLGLKIVNEKIHVCCRDQIVILHDLNGDGETDFYECFNNDHQVTDHFHEFAMGLQTDAEGNFYYARAARHALKALVPHHGTLLKVSKDGSKTEILATGFRAPNGVCLNPDGTFFLTDQEGFWLPKNRINLVEPGSYHGNFWGYHDVTDPSDSAMKKPVCWITNEFDRSPSEMLWITSDRWGPLKGSLLNFSYGYGKAYIVPYEKVGSDWQGGMSPLPLPQFPTGVMRARFHPGDGQLYCCGMFAWAGNQTQPGGFYRVRYTGKPVQVPVELHARESELTLKFTGTLDPKSVSDPKNFAVKSWALKRSQNYGSKHLDEKPVAIQESKLATDGKTVTLTMPDLQPTWCMEIRYTLTSIEGARVDGVIHNTIHQLTDAPPKQARKGPIKVFILAGQSNMEGQAVVDLDGPNYNFGKGTLKQLMNDPAKAPRFAHLKNKKGEWIVRNDVWVRYQPENGPLKAGPLSIGFSPYQDMHHFGPELQFGYVVGDHFQEQILIIKTAWGGKSLYKDFRPPSSGGAVGPYYTKMMTQVRQSLESLKKDFPDYQSEGFEIAGFVWYHGWNDGVDPKNAIPEYEKNLVNLIHDVRKEWKVPNLPVVVGELTGPWIQAPGAWATLRKAQASATTLPEFKGTVLFVETHDFVRKPEDSPNPGHGHHEFGNAETYFLVGDALGKGMLDLLKTSK